MSSSATPPPTPPPTPPGQEPWRTGPGTPPPVSRGNSGWVTGGVLFAGVVMMLTGVLDVFRGIAAIAEDEVFLNTPRYTFEFDLTGWGWIHLILGLLLAVTGFFVVKGAAWARYTGIFLASLSAVEAFLSLPYYPLWALVIIALDVFVIWALCTYREDPAY